MPLPPARGFVADIEIGASGLFTLWLRITRILEVQDKHARLLESQAAQIAALRDAVHALQAREDVLPARAGAAASQVASVSVTDLARRRGHLEARSSGSRAETD
jgi:hypothetical protein